MDGSRFDALSRTLVVDYSRRGVTRLLGTLVLGEILGLQQAAESTAKGRRGGGKKRKKRGQPSVLPTAPPTAPPVPHVCQGRDVCVQSGAAACGPAGNE